MKTTAALQRELTAQLTLLDRAKAIISYAKAVAHGSHESYPVWLAHKQMDTINSWRTYHV